MPLGDSITWGVGSATTSSYRQALWNMLAGQSRYSVRFVGSQASGSLPGFSNEGHSGYAIDQIRSGIDGWLTGTRPDVVLLHIGINDLNRGIDTAHALERRRIPAHCSGVLRPAGPGIQLGEFEGFGVASSALLERVLVCAPSKQAPQT
jgi:lysophospholipase L1-like esterase